MLESLAQARPDYPGLFRLAAFYFRTGRQAEAAALIERLRQAHPKDETIATLAEEIAQGAAGPLPKGAQKPK